MYSLGIDIGTTSCKLCVLSSQDSNRLVFSEQLAHDAHLSQPESPSFDEQSASKIIETINTLLAHADIHSIKSIQVSGQMHGLILWSSQSPRTVVSSLVTWQDQRCSKEFLDSLGPQLNHLRTGYGLATLLWLSKEQRDEGFDRAGTIADYFVATLCDDSSNDSSMSDQMATSWGAVGKTWPMEHRLLPKIVEPGTVIGYWKKNIPIYVGLGDLQCSVFSCQPGKDQGIVNLSTSAQLALVVDREQKNPTGNAAMRVPYFQSKDLLVAASLNGGNVLSAFVHLVHSWQVSLTDSSPSIDQLWPRLIELALRSSSMPLDHFSAALFGERHDPSMCAEIRHLRSMNISQLKDVGCVFRSICRWIIRNLFDMLGDDVQTLKGLIGTGSALMRNAVLQDELRQRIDDQLVFNEQCDAASDQKSMEEADVVVIGGGISGLYAAYRIQQKAPQLKILVLEAKDRLGGRTLTVDMKASQDETQTDRFDLGGQWVTDTQENVTALLRELQLDTYPQYHTGKSIAELQRRIHKYSLPMPYVSLLSFLESIYSVFRLENLVSTVPTWNPMMTRNAEYLDQQTLAHLMRPWIQNSMNPLMTAAVRTVFGCEPEQLNALFALTYAQAGGGFLRLSLTEPGCAQEKKIKGGSQQISILLAQRLGTENVRLEMPVQKIVQKDDDTVEVIANGTVFQCRKVIIAIPPSQIIPIQFEPLLPGYKREMLKHMPIGSYVKFIFTFDKAFWRDDGFNGEVVSDGSFAPLGLSIGPMTYLIDGTTSVGTPALLGFIGGRCASVWTSVTRDERRKALLECLSRYFGGPKVSAHLIDYAEKDWNVEPYSGGCPCHNATTGSMKDFVDGLRKPYGHLHFAGTETASQWMGYMDGAIDAGRRAASEVLVALRAEEQPKDNDVDPFTFESQNRKYQNCRVPRSNLYYAIPIIIVTLAALSKILFPAVFQ